MWSTLLSLSSLLALALGHGRVLNPAGRGSMWRSGFPVSANYDDDGLNCGGYYHQYSVNGGKCGICGDPYDSAEPRAHEMGGRYGTGIISATYESGSVFTATIQISAYHKGFWEFKLCTDPYNNNQECFDRTLELESGGTKYYPSSAGTYYVNYKLPEGLSCEHCVLQWFYTAGNNWGICEDGSGALGCGDQEMFGACSDIAITGGSQVPGTPEETPEIPEEIPESSEEVEVEDNNEIPEENPDAGYIPVVPLLDENYLNDIGLIKLLINGAIKPHGWTQQTKKPPRRITKPKRKKHKHKDKRKKKGKPYKKKWKNYWRKKKTRRPSKKYYKYTY